MHRQHETVHQYTKPTLLDTIVATRSLLDMCVDEPLQEVEVKTKRKLLCALCHDPNCYLSREE
jgi:hypothetical protein